MLIASLYRTFTHFHLQLSNTLWLGWSAWLRCLMMNVVWQAIQINSNIKYNDAVRERERQRGKKQQQQRWQANWGWALLRFLSTLMSAPLTQHHSPSLAVSHSVRLYSQPIWNASHRKSLNEWWRCENYLSVQQFNQKFVWSTTWESEEETASQVLGLSIFIFIALVSLRRSLFILYLPVKHSIDHAKHIGYFSVS